MQPNLLDPQHAAQLLVAAQSCWQREWTVAVELCVHVQARAFGFQVVNASQEANQKGQCTPATSAVAADHLMHLLKDRAAVVAAETPGQTHSDADHVFKESIASLHAAYFAQGPYQSWMVKSNVKVLDNQLKRFAKSRSLKVGRSVAAVAGPQDGSSAAGLTGVSDAPEWVRQLAELSLYFLLWTEAANLRHTPELLWLLYHVMLSSGNYNKACAVLGSADTSHYSLLRWLPGKSANGRGSARGSVGSSAAAARKQASAPLSQLASEEVYTLGDDIDCYERVRELGFVRGVLLPVRNALGDAARVGALLEEGPGPYNAGARQGNGVQETSWWGDFPTNDLAARQVSGLNVILSQPGVASGIGLPEGYWCLAQLVLEDFAFFGDGCVFLDMVIQPVFNLMAEQVCLMGDMGESPALRLGFDDFNESACMPQVLSALVLDLSGEHFVDPWDGLLKRFVTSHAAVEAVASQSNYADPTFKPVTPAMQQRYPRDPRRLEELAAKLRDAGAGGVKGSAALRRRWEQQQQHLRQEGQPAEGEGDWVAPSANGSMPVVHLFASLRVTDSLWAKLFKKSFIETRSIGAVAVAFSRVYMLHAILLCWMSLLAYRVPDLSLAGPNSIFTGGFWSAHGLTVGNCLAWGVFLHAVLHVVKDLLIIRLLATPSAVRYQLDVSEKESTAKKPVGFLARMRLTSARRTHHQQDDRIEQIVQPPVHGGGMLKLHNIATLLFWLACCVILLDSHIPSWPLNKLLTKALTKPGQSEPSMPVWGLMSLVYVGLWVLHWLSGALADSLPSSLSKIAGLARKDSRRAAEHYYPYGAMSGSQNWSRFLMNTILWVLVLLVKVLFDFFVVLQPLGTGAVRKLLLPLDSNTPWTRWAEAVLAVWSLWVAAAFLVFYDTGLFWQLISSVYSTLFLGMRRRIGHVKTWYDLVWAFPRLSYKFNQRMIPQQAQLARTWGSSGGGAASKDAAAVPHVNGGAEADGRPAPRVSVAGESSTAPAVRALQLVPLNSSSEVVFHQAWNQIVDDLRSRDLLSNAESGSLKYVHLGWGQGREVAWLLLPKFVTAGAAVEAVGQRGLTSKTQIEVIVRCFNWLVWLLAALNMLEEAEVKALLLVASSAEAGSKGSGPREASTDDLLDAAKVLIKSRELLDVLVGKLAATAAPFCPLGAKDDPTKPDVNTQMLLAETLGAVAALARPKLPRDTLAAIKARPHTLDLTDKQADPCSDLFELRVRDQDVLDAAKAAEQMLKVAEGRGQEAVAEAKQLLVEAQQQVQVGVLEPRKRRRQLYQQVVGWLLDMLKHTRGEAVPKSNEAVRALTFFATSLSNPKIPTAQPVALTRSMTTLTPHYGEGVIYALSEAAANAEMGTKCGSDSDDLVLLNEQEEPTETLNYLRIVYKREWANFQERLFGKDKVRQALERHSTVGQPTAASIKEAHFLPGQPLHEWRHELLAWASMRGQLLQRTVHGMMYYETALQQLILMQCRPQLTKMARAMARDLAAQMQEDASGALRQQFQPDGWADQVAEEAALLLARERYSYVVSSQVLGEMQLGGKVMQRWLAHSIRSVLTEKYKSLRIAYIDLENLGELPSVDAKAAAAAAAAAGAGQPVLAGPRNRGRGGKAHRLLRQYSVLLQHDSLKKTVVEVYRVRLPINLETDRGVILGEGKPENQNHAIIFCHTEAVQTIDCNQDNFFVEALKLPNLLAEFEYQDGRQINVRGSLSQQQKNRSGCWAKMLGSGVAQGPALLGFREWIFSEDSGALAEFAAATERSFGTTVQRVMHNPGGCRFHYGHPDVWDKLFTMTNGGVSKSTKSLHVSEDVFGGYNVMLRGRDVAYVDYIAVGKGRDMGFETINTFEAKIAAGNGEQVVSRDVSRLARRMNMPRLLSWYFTGNGFFINTALLMYSMLVNAWLCLLLVLLSGISSTGTVLNESLAVVGGLQLLQLGSLSVLVYIATVWLEDGFFTTIKNVLKQFVAGSMFFYVFRGQTSAAAFKSDLAYGGATYAATGRGYKLKATPFLEVFMRYGRTHMWFGAHLLVLLILAVALGLKASLLVAWANILAILSLLAAPFWFNPFSLDWQNNKEAAREWMDWMAGHKPASSGSGKKLWRQYNEEQLQKAADDAQRQLGRTGNNIFGLLFMFPSLIIICVAVYGMLDAWWGGIIVIFAVNGVLGVLMACWHMATHLEAVRNAAVLSRSVKFVLKVLMAAAAILLFVFMVDATTRKKIDLFRIVVRVLTVEFELARLSGRLLIAFLPRWQPARRLVSSMCWVADYAVGLVLLLLLFIGSLFGLLTRYQAAVLFSMGYAAHYLAEEGLKHSEVGRLAKELKDLQRQERSVERKADNQTHQQQQQPEQRPSTSTDNAPAPSGGTPPPAAQQQPWATGLFGAPPVQLRQAGASTASAVSAVSDAPSSAASGRGVLLPSMAAVRAFVQGQQQQQQEEVGTQPGPVGSVTSSRSSSMNVPGGSPGPSVTAPPAAGVSSSSTRQVSVSRNATAAGGQQGALQPAVAEEASLVASPAARTPPPEDMLRSWNVPLESPQHENLHRVLQRSDTSWTRGDYEAGPDIEEIGSGGLTAEIVREASEAGAAAAARTASSGSAAAPLEGTPRPGEEV